MASAGSGKCSICGKNAGEKTRPFCSPRCATIDLGRWLGEGYRIPAEENADEGDSLPNRAAEEE